MNKISNFHLVVLVFGLAAYAALSAPTPAYALGDYDLQMLSIDGHPATLESGCNNRLKPHFSINGADDRYVASGGAFVRFRYHTGTQSTWTDLGNVPVTYSASDLGGIPYPFASGQAWPDDYASVSSGFADSNSLEFFLSSGVTQISVEAKVDYNPNQTDPNGNAITDRDPSNNTLETIFSAAPPAQTCTLGPTFTDLCKLNPRICNFVATCNTPGCIILVVDPGQCPMCGGILNLDVTVSLPGDYRIVVYTKDNREVARSLLLEKNVSAGGKTYNQKLAFEAKKGETYSFKAIAVKERVGKAAIKPDFQIRKMENIRMAPNTIKKIAPVIEKPLTR
jgi:hypothetical protein